MPYWLCYTTCLACTGQCSVCEHRDQPLSVHVVQRDRQPCIVHRSDFSTRFGKVAPVDRDEPFQWDLPGQGVGMRLSESLLDLCLI